MARTPSNMLPLGTKASDFKLKDVQTGSFKTFNDVSGSKGTLVMFICNHCPFVKHIEDELVKLGLDYMNKGIGVVAISSNDIEKYPADSPEKMKELAEEKGYSFPYLFDETQSVAKSYDAACTPDFYLYDAEAKLAYRGQLDDSRPGSEIPVTGKDLRAAIEAVIAGRTPGTDQKPSLGCNIKWKES